MKLLKKSEWFEFPSPIAEPDIKWNSNYPYHIERLLKEDGEIIWFGEATNWVKKPGDSWRHLGVDENVKPTVFIPGSDGMGDYYEYPEGRNIFIPCDPPIYEIMYIKFKQWNRNLN